MQLTTHAIEGMGFSRINAGEEIVACFHSLNVFEVLGFTVSEGACFTIRSRLSEFNYQLAIGFAVNDISLALLGDAFTDDEAAWAIEHKCSPPYAVLHCGPTPEQTSELGYAKHEGSIITTYDSFSFAKDRLQAIEANVLPAVQTSLATAFTSDARKVRFRLVDRNVFGLTTDKVVVHDLRIGGSATAYTSVEFSGNEVQTAIQRAVDLAPLINPKVAQFFKLAVEDQDPLKRFLYFFLAIEIETHKVFASIAMDKSFATPLNLPDRIRASALKLFENTSAKWNLVERFTWCIVVRWHHMSESDVVQFKQLKKIRDRIAHGVISVPPGNLVVAVEELAGKLQQSKLSNG